MRNKRFIKNTFILTGTALLLRTIGMFFRVYMSGKIGSEGMGLYQMVFSVYILAATFATSGISTAVTRLIADELGRGTKKSVLKILNRALAVTFIIGLISAFLMLFGADFIGKYWLKDIRAIPALKILSFSLPFMGISSCLRGYFIACRRVSNPSNAQIFEQLVRISVVVVLIDRFASKGLTFTCAAVLLGDTIAEMCSCGYMYIGYIRDRRKLEENPGQPDTPTYRVLPRLMSIAVPIAAGRYLSTFLRTVENLLVPDCLTKYTRSKEISLSQFGMLKGMAMPIIFFPSSFLSALSTLLIPEISQANSLGQKNKVNTAVNRSIHITLTLSILISGLFLLFSRELGIAIYGSEEVGFFICALAPLVPLMYLESVVDGILKGLNQQVSSLLYNVVDSAVRIVMIILLVPIKGMLGFLLVMVVSNILTACLNFRRLLVVTKLKIKWGNWFIKPLLSMVASGALLFSLCRLIEGKIGIIPLLFIGIPAACVVYFAMLFLSGGVTRQDMQFFRSRPGK